MFAFAVFDHVIVCTSVGVEHQVVEDHKPAYDHRQLTLMQPAEPRTFRARLGSFAADPDSNRKVVGRRAPQ